MAEKKAKLGTSCMKDFNFHTAHLKYTVSQSLILNLGEKGEEAVKLALADYVDTFGQEYLDVLNGLYPVEYNLLLIDIIFYFSYEKTMKSIYILFFYAKMIDKHPIL